MTKMYRTLCLTIMLLALTARCLVPAGFMPGQGEGFTLVICTPAGMETITVDGDHNPVPDNHNPAAMADCPFAPVLAFGMVPDAPPVAVSHLDYQPFSYPALLPLRLAALPRVYAAQAPPVIFSI